MRSAPIRSAQKNELRGTISDESGAARVFLGEVSSVEDAYLFVKCVDIPDDLLMSVTYTRKRITSDKLFSDDQSVKESEMNRLLSTKFSHWRYESEMRCFVSLEDKESHNGHHFYKFSDEMKIKQIFVGAEASVSRHDVERALGKENAHVERVKTRAAFKTFRVVRNGKQSLWH